MIAEHDYQDRYEDLIAWYQASYTEKRINSCSGRDIRVAVPDAEEHTLNAVIVSGRTEFIEKYLELARDLQWLGISAILYDHIGQGGSDRLLNDPEKGYIDDFDTYVDDLRRVLEETGSADSIARTALISHSMGGTISLLFALHYQTLVDRIVLVSPMCAIRTGVPLPQFATRQVVNLACRVGFGDRYVETAGPYRPDRPFEGNLFTTDADRFGFNRYLTNRLDFVRLGGPTYRWLREAFKAMDKVGRNMAAIRCPLLILGAAQDRVIQLRAVKLLGSLVEDCRYQEFDHSRHELFMENERTRGNVITQVSDFLAPLF